MTAAFWACLGLLLACLFAVVALRRRVPVAVPPAIGAVLVVGLGFEPVGAVARLWGVTWDAVVTLLALMVLAGALDRLGFFVWCAEAIARSAGASGVRLWWGLMLLACLTAAVLANDGAMLLLVPLYVEIARGAGFTPRQTLAFLVPTCFLIDAASATFSTSNLTNLMLADSFHLGFLAYARLLAVPSLAMLGAALAACWGLFARQVPRQLASAEAAADAAVLLQGSDAAVLAIGIPALVALVVGFVASHLLGVPVAYMAGGVALLLAAVVFWRGELALRDFPRLAPWSVAVFALGMFVLVDALARQGAERLMVAAWAGGASWAIGGTVALLASALDNLPAVLMGIFGLGHVAPEALHPAIAATVVGADIGCKLTPYGSLSTLLWLRLLADKGVKVSWRQYFLYGAVLTPPLLAAGLLAAHVVR